MAAPPDPAIPGLLDLLTVHALVQPASAPGDSHPAASSERRDAPAGPAQGSTGSRRLWVEVEVEVRA